MGKLIVEMFHENRIALQVEIKKHPELMERLANHQQDEFEICLAEIASYCDVLLHGDYLPSDLDGLCGVLVKKLMEKRTPLILSSIPSPPPHSIN